MPTSEILVGSPRLEAAERLAELDPRARAVDAAAAAVRRSDVVCLCTHSGGPCSPPAGCGRGRT